MDEDLRIEQKIIESACEHGNNLEDCISALSDTDYFYLAGERFPEFYNGIYHGGPSRYQLYGTALTAIISNYYEYEISWLSIGTLNKLTAFYKNHYDELKAKNVQGLLPVDYYENLRKCFLEALNYYKYLIQANFESIEQT